MLSNSQLQDIAKRAGINPQSFIDALNASEEKQIDLSNDGAFFTIEESQALESKGKKLGYEEGKTAGYEILTKEVKKLAEVEFEGKTAQNVVNALKDKFATEAGKEPNKLIEDLTKDKQKLQALLSEKETELNTKISEFQGQLNHLTIESKLKLSVLGILNVVLVMFLVVEEHNVQVVLQHLLHKNHTMWVMLIRLQLIGKLFQVIHNLFLN